MRSVTQRKHFLLLLTLILAFILPVTFPFTAYAASYRDVPSSHYAFAAVDWVSNPLNGSIMVGDINNNFNPTKSLDKFEAAKIYAMAAGYKYTAAAITPAEQEAYNRAYDTYRTLLDSMAGQYAKWNKTVDREIAFLLYNNILSTAELNYFITRANNQEQVNYLTKQEALAFIVRLDKKQANADAIALPYHTPYRDDAQINADYKKFVYYAREAKIMLGSDGYINPARPITRVELAQIFYNTSANRPGSSAYVPTQNGSTVTGTIDSLYLNTHVYIAGADNIPKVYKWAVNAVITVDNVQRTSAFLLKGMYATAVTNAAGEIASLVAVSTGITPSPTPPTAGNLLENEGYVSAVSTLSGGQVTIRTQRVKLSGEVVTDENIFSVAPTCTIQRGSLAVTFADIKVNDIISFQYSGTVLYTIKLQEKNRVINGTLMEKKYIDTTARQILVIEDAQKVRHELQVSAATVFYRNAVRMLAWTDMRIGDTVEVQCEYNTILSIYGTGTTSVIQGKLEEIHITQNNKQIMIRKPDNTVSTHTIIPGSQVDVNFYATFLPALKLGVQLSLMIDSLEISGINVLTQ
jgi:hypothetical protein